LKILRPLFVRPFEQSAALRNLRVPFEWDALSKYSRVSFIGLFAKPSERYFILKSQRPLFAEPFGKSFEWYAAFKIQRPPFAGLFGALFER
jgi:hypothetical protein